VEFVSSVFLVEWGEAGSRHDERMSVPARVTLAGRNRLVLSCAVFLQGFDEIRRNAECPKLSALRLVEPSPLELLTYLDAWTLSGEVNVFPLQPAEFAVAKSEREEKFRNDLVHVTSRGFLELADFLVGEEASLDSDAWHSNDGERIPSEDFLLDGEVHDVAGEFQRRSLCRG